MNPLPPMPPMPSLPVPAQLPPIVPTLGPSFGAAPVGAVIAFAGTLGAHSPPLEASGWMVCDGRAVDKDECAELFNVIGYTYSARAGGQSFQIPNLQGYFLRGVDPSGTVDPDLDKRVSVSQQPYQGVGSIQPSAFQLHEHQLSAATASAQPSQSGKEAGTTTTATETTTEVVAEPGGEPLNTSKYESRPINVAVYFILRYASELGAPRVGGGR